MSIAIAIARVFPAKETIRRFTIGLAVFFGLMFVALQITIACIGAPVTSSNPGRHKCQWAITFVHSYLFSAYLVSYILLPFCFEIDVSRTSDPAVNIIADLVLVGVPLYKLRRVRLPTRQRKLILGGFAASLVPALGVVISAVFQLAPSSWEPGRTEGRFKVNYMQVQIFPSLSIHLLTSNRTPSTSSNTYFLVYFI